MNSKTSAFLATVLAASSALSGCISDEDPASILVGGNVVPVSQGTTCAYKSADLFYSSGVLDLSIRDSYVFGAQIFSSLPTTKAITGEDEKTLRPETNQISVEKAIVSFEPFVPVNSQMPLGGGAAAGVTKKALVLSWEVPVQVTLTPGGNAIMPFFVVPTQVKAVGSSTFASLGTDWQHRYRNFKDRYTYRLQGLLHVAFEGVTAGGSTVKSEKFSYPLTLCWGCLLGPNFLKPTADLADQWKDCSKMVITGDYKPPCNIGQEEPVHCAHACQICRAAETISGIKCDEKFCPPLD